MKMHVDVVKKPTVVQNEHHNEKKGDLTTLKVVNMISCFYHLVILNLK